MTAAELTDRSAQGLPAAGAPVERPVMAQAPARDGLCVVPCDLKTANEFVRKMHRHSRPVVGHRFSVGVADADGVLRGVAIIGRPVAPRLDDGKAGQQDGRHKEASFHVIQPINE